MRYGRCKLQGSTRRRHFGLKMKKTDEVRQKVDEIQGVSKTYTDDIHNTGDAC